MFKIERNEIGEQIIWIDGRKMNGVYTGMKAENDSFVVLGMHDENPRCYKWLDYAVVYEKSTEKYGLVRLYTLLAVNSDGQPKYNNDGAKLLSLWYDDMSKSFYAKSDYATVVINVNNVVADDVKPGFVYENKNPSKNDISSCFIYEVLSDMSVVMMLNPKISRNSMFKWPGFTKDYDMFKLSGAIEGYGQSYLVFANTDDNKTWTVSYGISTTMTSDAVWKRRDVLVNCIKEKIPNHPSIRESTYMTKI